LFLNVYGYGTTAKDIKHSFYSQCVTIDTLGRKRGDFIALLIITAGIHWGKIRFYFEEF